MTVETEDKTKKSAVQPAAEVKDFAVKEEKQLDYSKRTHGEKRFDQANWVLGYIVTFAASVGIAYLFRDSSWKFPFKKKLDNGTKVDQTFSEWTADLKTSISNSDLLKSFRNPTGTPDDKKKHFDNNRLGQIITNTLVTFPGGFMMLPVERWMEKNKQGIVRWFNKRTGDADQVAIGDARTENHKVSGWGTLLLGRITAIATVLASFMTLEVLIPKTMGGIEGDFENWFVKAGDKVSKLRNNGQPMERPAVGADGKFIFDRNTPKPFKRWFQMGNLSAIDSIATAASVTVVFLANSFFKGEKKHEAKFAEKHATADFGSIEIEKRQAEAVKQKSYHHREDMLYGGGESHSHWEARKAAEAKAHSDQEKAPEESKAPAAKHHAEEASRTAKPQPRSNYQEEAEREKANPTLAAVSY